MPALSPAHLLARRYTGKTLITAAASRIAAEALHQHDGLVPEQLVTQHVARFRSWLIAAIESAVLPVKQRRRDDDVHHDDDDDDE